MADYRGFLSAARSPSRILLFAVFMVAWCTERTPAQMKVEVASGEWTPKCIPEGAIARFGTLCLRHKAPARVAVFSPDGKTIASGGEDGSIYLWDVITGKQLRRFRRQLAEIRALAFSPDGTLLASGSGSRGEHAQVTLWDLARGKELSLPGHRSNVNCLLFANNGKILITAAGASKEWVRGGDPGLRFWDTTTGKQLRESDSRVCVLSLALAPDETTLLFPDENGKVRRWDMLTGKEHPPLAGIIRRASLAAYSPNGNIIAFVDRDTIRLWNTRDKKVIHVLKGHQGGIGNVMFNSTQELIASAGDDGTIRFWSVTTGKEVRCLSGHRNGVGDLSFSSDGKLLISVGRGDEHELFLWDVNTGSRVIRAEGHANAISGVAVSPDGMAVAVCDGTGVVQLYSRLRNKRTPQFTASGRVLSVAFSPNGEQLAGQGWSKDGKSGSIHLWDVRTGKQRRVLPDSVPSTFTPPAFSPDGKLIASAHIGGTTIWNSANGKVLHLLEDQFGALAVGFSPCGKLVAAGGARSIRLYEVASGETLFELPLAPESDTAMACYALAFSPDGRALAVATGGYPHHQYPTAGVRVYEVITGMERCRFGGKSQALYAVAFSPDGRMLIAAGEDGELLLWDMRTGKALPTLGGHGAPVNALAFAPDGKTVVSGSHDTTAVLWDFRSHLKAVGRQEKR